MSIRGHKAIFFAYNGPGPYECKFCSKDVLAPWEADKVGITLRSSASLHVHHVDGDCTNNDPSNLVAVHSGCHTRHHMTGQTVTEAQRKARSENLKGRVFSLEHRRRISAAKKGKRVPALKGNRNAARSGTI